MIRKMEEDIAFEESMIELVRDNTAGHDQIMRGSVFE